MVQTLSRSASTSAVTKNASIELGSGTNTATIAGTIGGSLRYNGRDGNDTVTIEQTATITDNVFASLGNGVNVFLHNGTISGNLKAVSKNADDSITVGGTGHRCRNNNTWPRRSNERRPRLRRWRARPRRCKFTNWQRE